MRKWFHLSVPLIDGESGRDQKVSSLEAIDCIIIIIIIIIIVIVIIIIIIVIVIIIKLLVVIVFYGHFLLFITIK